MFRVIFVVGVFLTSIYPNFPALADRTHMPSYVFEDHPSGKKAVNPRQTVNVPFDLKGKTKAGKRLLAAVIDSHINANLPHMRDLKHKGLIHPAALAPNNPYMVNPEEDFDKYELIDKELRDQRFDLIMREISAESPEEKYHLNQQIQIVNTSLEVNQKKREEANPRKWRLEWDNLPDALNHGSGVIHALHKVAPETSILPIDLLVLSTVKKDNKELTESQVLTQGIRAAIDHGADIINLSRYLTDLDQEGFQAMAEAVRKGVILVIAAGNDSNDSFICYIRQLYDRIKKIFVTSKEQELFEKLNGKGIVFAGSTSIDSSGKEQVSDYSQHPEEDTKRNFLLAPGEYLNIQANNNPHTLVRGTSFSAPIIAGALLDLKQHCLDKGYKVTSDHLIQILYDSGHNIVYKGVWPYYSNETYKSVDIEKACKHADEKFKPTQPQSSLRPAKKKSTGKTKVVIKPEARKKALKAKKPPKKPIVKQKTVKIKRTRRKPATQTKPALIKSRSKKPVSKKVKAPKKSIIKQKTVRPKKTHRKPITNKKSISKKRVKSKK